jgi:hypothetical protein
VPRSAEKYILLCDMKNTKHGGGRGKVLISVFHGLLQYYSKLEEKHQAMEEQKTQLEARLKVICLFCCFFIEDASSCLLFLVFILLNLS